jgi:hypothetical protein
MSTSIYRPFRPLPPDYVPELRRKVWGELFGLFIRGRRNEINMLVEEAAGLSGMTVSEWARSKLAMFRSRWIGCGPYRPPSS